MADRSPEAHRLATKKARRARRRTKLGYADAEVSAIWAATKSRYRTERDARRLAQHDAEVAARALAPIEALRESYQRVAPPGFVPLSVVVDDLNRVLADGT